MWKVVEGFPNYEVSDEGFVKNVKTGRVLRPVYDRGYQKVSLRRDNKSHTKKIHCLVAFAFIGPRPEGMEVCHKNNDKDDNSVENLRYDTHDSNMKDSIGVRLKTHCAKGHRWTKETTHIRPNGYRRCKVCEFAGFAV